MKFITHINLNGLELQNPVLHNLATAPSTPKAGWFYFDTANHTAYMYNGTSWLDMLSQGRVYTAGTGIAISNNNEISVTDPVLVNDGEGNHSLCIDLGSSFATGDYSIAIGNYSGASGDYSIQIGGGESDITGDNATAIGYGADCSGDYGVAIGSYAMVSADYAIQLGVGSNSDAGTLKVGLSSEDNYELLDANGIIPNARLDLDTTPTQNSGNPITSGGVYSAIASAVTGALIYQGTWTATSQTDYSSITLPVKKGYMYIVAGSATVGGVEWNAGDYLVINKDVAAGGTITSADVDKIDNTEGSDIVRLNATQTLTNKTIDADDNTISDLTTANLKSGVLVTSVRSSSSASDTAIASEKAVASLVEGKKATFTNPALTASGGVCTWSISTTLAPDCQCIVRETSSGEEVMCDKTYGSGTITVSMIAASVAAGTYTAVVLG